LLHYADRYRLPQSIEKESGLTLRKSVADATRVSGSSAHIEAAFSPG
jgi:hypothetical protein